jgi:SAM-dependent methyltransferase
METNILSYYNQLAPLYDADRFANTYGQFIHAQELRFLEKNMLKNKQPILDMGCGTGRFLQFAQVGVDISPEMLKIAAEKFPKVALHQEDATNSSFPNAAFAQVYSMHVFMHLDAVTTKAIIAEAHRILATNGQFIFDFPSRKRRNLTQRKEENWHGSNTLSIEDTIQIIDNQWIVKYYEGVLFLPIHHFPKRFRKYLLGIDTWLCKSFLKNYASYLIVVLEKK